MGSSSPTIPSAIRLPAARYEESHIKTSAGAKLPTKAIKVTWELSQTVQLADGEWSVTWDGMDDVTANATDEGYGSLTTSTLDSAGLAGGHLCLMGDANQLENLDDGYFEKIFNDRALVQSPTKVLPPALAASPVSPTFPNRFSVYFLLNSQMPVPRELTICFTPTWSSPITPSPCITVPVSKADQETHDQAIHRSWAKYRLADLRELQELADELAKTGDRGLNTGIMKMGVDGSAHDVERVKWEAEMVGRERNWVLKTFLGGFGQDAVNANGHATEVEDGDEELTEEKEIEKGLKLLEKLAKGLKVASHETETPVQEHSQQNFPIQKPAPSRNRSKGSEDREDDLFALPLSPRSPDMSVSPFSVFRGPALENLDSILSSGLDRRNVLPSSLNITPVNTNAIHVESRTPSTPTLMGSPNPEDMRKRRTAGGNLGL